MRWVEQLTKADDGRGAHNLTLIRCTSCGLVRLQTFSSSFEPTLYSYYSSRLDLSRDEVYDPLTNNRYRVLLDRFDRHLRRYQLPKSVLDVGCGAGHFVAAANELGWNADGIELSTDAVALGLRLGANVRRADFLDGSAVDYRPSVITMFEVVEHLPKPHEFLLRAASLLPKNGLLYVTTPNFSSIDRMISGPEWDPIHSEHLYYFTPKTLVRLAADVEGLHVQSIETVNVSIASLRRLSPLPESRRTPNVRAADQALRKTAESKPALKAAKWITNVALNAAKVGSALKATFVKI